MGADTNNYVRAILVVTTCIAATVIVLTNQPDAAVKVGVLIAATQSLVNFLMISRVHGLVNSQTALLLDTTSRAANAEGRMELANEQAIARDATRKPQE